MTYLCALALFSLAFPGQQSAPVLIRVNAKLGSVYRFRIDTDMTAVGEKGTMGSRMLLTEKLDAIRNGDFIWHQTSKIESTYSTGVFKGVDSLFRQLDSLKFAVATDGTGQIKRFELDGKSFPASGTSNVVFSKIPVRVGDTWRATVEGDGIKVDIDYKLINLRTKEGRRIAVISGTYLSGQPIRNASPLVFWVDLADGKLNRSEGSIFATKGAATVKVKFVLRRI